MDISVHCDVSNFEWLMLWVRRDQSNPTSWPQLGNFPNNMIFLIKKIIKQFVSNYQAEV